MCVRSRWLAAVAAVVVLLVGGAFADVEPAITAITKDMVANAGDNVEFNCTVAGVGRMSVSWAKYTSETDFVVLSMRNILSLNDPHYAIDETKDTKTDSATYTLQIANVEVGDMGPYECQVIVSAAHKVTKRLNLAIRHPPIIVEDRTPRSVLVAEGQDLEVSCHASGFPQPTMFWRRDLDAIMPAGGHTFFGSVLRVKDVHRLDRGGYYCVAENGVGRPSERLIRVEVEFRPQIAVQRPKVAQMLARPVEMECSVQGYPAPAVSWHRNGVKLQTTAEHIITNMASSHETTTSVLRIRSVTSDDFGDYYCNATNKLGHADARLHLFQAVIPVPTSP